MGMLLCGGVYIIFCGCGEDGTFAVGVVPESGNSKMHAQKQIHDGGDANGGPEKSGMQMIGMSALVAMHTRRPFFSTRPGVQIAKPVQAIRRDEPTLEAVTAPQVATVRPHELPQHEDSVQHTALRLSERQPHLTASPAITPSTAVVPLQFYKEFWTDLKSWDNPMQRPCTFSSLDEIMRVIPLKRLTYKRQTKTAVRVGILGQYGESLGIYPDTEHYHDALQRVRTDPSTVHDLHSRVEIQAKFANISTIKIKPDSDEKHVFVRGKFEYFGADMANHQKVYREQTFVFGNADAARQFKSIVETLMNVHNLTQLSGGGRANEWMVPSREKHLEAALGCLSKIDKLTESTKLMLKKKAESTNDGAIATDVMTRAAGAGREHWRQVQEKIDSKDLFAKVELDELQNEQDEYSRSIQTLVKEKTAGDETGNIRVLTNAVIAQSALLYKKLYLIHRRFSTQGTSLLSAMQLNMAHLHLHLAGHGVANNEDFKKAGKCERLCYNQQWTTQSWNSFLRLGETPDRNYTMTSRCEVACGLIRKSIASNASTSDTQTWDRCLTLQSNGGSGPEVREVQIRHGQSYWNMHCASKSTAKNVKSALSAKCSKLKDPFLTPEGVKQAKENKDFINNHIGLEGGLFNGYAWDLVAVISSPLTRALTTAVLALPLNYSPIAYMNPTYPSTIEIRANVREGRNGAFSFDTYKKEMPDLSSTLAQLGRRLTGQLSPTSPVSPIEWQGYRSLAQIQVDDRNSPPLDADAFEDQTEKKLKELFDTVF